MNDTEQMHKKSKLYDKNFDRAKLPNLFWMSTKVSKKCMAK